MALEDELREELAEIYSQQLEENDTECPYDNGSATVFNVEIWVDKNDQFAGEALCLSCNRLFELLWKNEYEEKRTEEEGIVQYDKIQKRMKQRSRQINSHVSSSKSIEVHQEVVDELEELSRLCSSLSDITTGIANMEDFKERGEDIIEQAKKVEDQALTKLSE